MSTPELNKPAPDFDLPATSDQHISLSSLKGSKVVLFFYPRDATPGCTTESQNFRDAKAKFTRQNAIILGVSRDSIKRHENFKAKQKFNFDLLSDENETLCKQFDVIKLKKLYGREYMGVDRSTFLIDEKGILLEEWRGVKVKQHVEQVLEACKKHK